MSNKFHHIFLLAAVLFSAALLWVLWQDQTGGNASVAIPGAKINAEVPLKIEGFSLSNYNEEKLAARIRADLVSVNPQKMFIFRLRSVNELFMKNVVIDAYFYREKQENGQSKGATDSKLTGDIFSADMVQGGFSHESLGRIAQVRMDEFEAFLYVDDQLTTKVEAQKGKSNPKERGIVFDGAKITHLESKRTISSKRIIWNSEKKRFDIPGDYQGETARGKVRGKSITISPDFTLKKLPEN